MKTLILTPNKNEMCGMYQLAKDLAKEFDGVILTKGARINTGFDVTELNHIYSFDTIITLLYPMHKHGKRLRYIYKDRIKWICYDQKIPPITKTYFPNFWRRQAMRYISWRNNATMQSADEYWDVTEREQKPRWIYKSILPLPTGFSEEYALYLGRITDYKNFDWLKKTMEELNIPIIHPENEPDHIIWQLLSNTSLLVTASLWEGYGRPVMEAEALGIPAVAYDVGAHKRHIKKGICVPLDINNMAKSEEEFKKAVLEVWNNGMPNT